MKQFTAAALVQAAYSVDVKSKLNLTQTQTTAPELGEKCCASVASLTHSGAPIKPTKAWVCDKLRNSFEQKWGECEHYTTVTFEEKGVYTQDATFDSSYTDNYNINGSDTKIDHIRTWFKYFCGGVEHTSNA